MSPSASHHSPLLFPSNHPPTRQLLQPLAPLNSHPNPLLHPLRPQSLIELNTGLIPLQHAPFQSPPIYIQHFLCQSGEQGCAVAVSPEGRRDKEVFEVYPGRGAPGGVVVEIKRECSRDEVLLLRCWLGVGRGCGCGWLGGGC
jgi:hypothetical protein